MINELDTVLKSILDDSGAPAEFQNADVSFKIPDEHFEYSQNSINMYLYDLHENRELRRPNPIIERVGRSYVRKLEPLRFDCSYMVTAWSIKTDDSQPAEEHQLISQAMQWLSRFPMLPESFLPAHWLDDHDQSYQPFSIPMWVAQMNGVKEPGEYWAALGTPPRPFFNLMVTIAMDLDREMDIGPEVSAKILHDELIGQPESKEKYLAQIGGRVIVKDSDPIIGIGGASVTIVELGRTVITDKDGYYTFTKISYGEDPSIEYTFRANADLYIEDEVKINVLKDDGDYTIELEPV